MKKLISTCTLLLVSAPTLAATTAAQLVDHQEQLTAKQTLSANAAGAGLSAAALAKLAAEEKPEPSSLPDPVAATKRPDISQLEVFGANLFSGAYAQQSFSGFNPNYVVSVGDKIAVKVYGALTAESKLSVDAQGNIFVPNVGPVRVLGVANGDLNRVVEEASRKVFRSSVHVYANLETAQPVKVFVTGGVTVPGLYGGLSSDSLLYYLDRAGGIDLKRGSFIDVAVKRGSAVRATFNLYDFLKDGRLPLIQLQDGDTIVVAPRKSFVTVAGDVSYATKFEFDGSKTVAAMFEIARPSQVATHFSLIRHDGTRRTAVHLPIAEAPRTVVRQGDELIVSSERADASILVRLDGAHDGERALALPYGATLGDLLDRVKPNGLSRMDAVQVYRQSVAARQRQMIETELSRLERMAYTTGSATNEESAIRLKEAEMVSKFIEKAKTVEPKGQVVLDGKEVTRAMILNDGDTVVIPERTTLLTLHGEVNFPVAMAHQPGKNVDYYIAKAGGYTKSADRNKVLVAKQNGVVLDASDSQAALEPGDEILVLPRVESKNLELFKSVSMVLYQMAVSAKIVFGL